MKPLKGKTSDRIRSGEIPADSVNVSRPVGDGPTLDGKRRPLRIDEIK